MRDHVLKVPNVFFPYKISTECQGTSSVSSQGASLAQLMKTWILLLFLEIKIKLEQTHVWWLRRIVSMVQKSANGCVAE